MRDNDDKLKSALDALKAAPEPGTFWRHVATGGEYMVCGGCVIEATVEPGVAYRDRNGVVWVRPVGEFVDGRVVEIDAPTEHSEQPEGGTDAGSS